MIAAVIYNRIEAGMPLQIDSTIMYVLPEHKDVLTVEDTKIDSPYNTYQNKGLPPTPIANPGLASIKATLSPASTQALTTRSTPSPARTSSSRTTASSRRSWPNRVIHNKRG